MKQDILDKLKKIKLFLFDLEGVLIFKDDYTSNNSYYEFLKEVENACKKFESYNLCFGIVSARQQDELINELNKLGSCKILSTTIEKVSTVKEFAAQKGIDFTNIFYMGDDILDIPLLIKCGLSSAPKSAKREVKRVVDFTVNSNNAKGIFNEIFSLIEKVINNKNN